jgi:DNA-binding response OmpR family regulator
MVIQVLIVDDEPDVLAVLSTIVEHEGYKVFLAEDYETASSLIEERHPDVVLLDINLGERNGLDLLRLIKGNAETADIAVIMVTALDLRDLMTSALSIGATDYILKPWESGEVPQCIKWALQRSQQRTTVAS